MRDQMPYASVPLTLGEMIDLQAVLERDADEDEQDLIKRDGDVGRRVNAAKLDDVSAVRAWLAEVGPPEATAYGSHLERWGSTLSWLLRVGAFAAGLLTVAGWLEVQGRQPINVINFWSALIGTQLVFLILLAASVLRWRWVIRRGMTVPGRASRALPWFARAIESLWVRVAKPDHNNGLPAATWSKVQRLYGELFGWVALKSTQALAVAYNVGATLGLVVWATISDPSFGWRSTLLDETTVHRWAQRIALPWSWSGWAGAPSPEVVAQTRYSSLEARFVEAGALGPEAELWAAWWPFLLLSLLVYGLVPRLGTYAWTWWRCKLALRGAPWRSAAADQLLHRMRRSSLSTVAEARPEPLAVDTPLPHALADEASVSQKPVAVMKWSGVPDMPPSVMETMIRFTLGRSIWGHVEIVGGRDLNADEAAVRKASAAQGEPDVAVMVQGWEPPVGDHVDFFEQLRRGLKAGRRIDVLVCGLSASDAVVAPTDAQMRLWRRRLEALGDPWLRVYPVRVEGLP